MQQQQKTAPRSAEIHPGPGFRVRADFLRPDPELVRRFVNFDTPEISDLLNRLYAVDPAIECLSGESRRLSGTACTVKVFPGDNLMVHASLDIAKPGDIVVIDANASRENAVLGDLITTKAKHRQIAGFIVDGLIRDLPEIQSRDFPVWARGTTPVGPLHRGPGEINYPIACGGVVINPGDIIVADSAGIVAIPQGIAADLMERLMNHQRDNAVYVANVQRGEFSNEWVDQQLERLGCPIDTTPPTPDVPVEPYAFPPEVIAEREGGQD
jgi:RraA family protein